tara:strand:+ start:842 stop:1699 length:858 start_codon:yes stop_codon:yes gene_type:complete
MKLLKKIRDFISFRNYRKRNNRIESYLKDIRELILNDQQDLTINKSKNPLNKYGKKIFSQSDEDGITIEIIKRINSLDEGIFVELGVGDGTENNTLILKALGWKGFWIGNEKLKIDYVNSKNFSYICSFVDLENVVDLLKKGSSLIEENLIDVISLDLDGNDYYFLEKIIENNFRPKLFIVEYNAKFPPPIKWKIEYEKDHKWKGDDYFGASLSTYNDFFEKNGYKLICCNAHTGANAYFIKKEFINLFQDVPDEIDDLYMKPRYLLNNYLRFPISLKTINKFFN